MVVPDDQGNFTFNTLSNLQQWPLAGLLFVKPDSGDVLQLDVRSPLTSRALLQHDWRAQLDLCNNGG